MRSISFQGIPGHFAARRYHKIHRNQTTKNTKHVLVKGMIHNHKPAFKLDRSIGGRRWIIVGAISSEPRFRYRVLRYIAVISQYGNRAYEFTQTHSTV